MKFLSLISSVLVASVASAGPIQKRAAVTDVATLGYATQNGGTKGGLGGPTTIVTTLAQLRAVANATGPQIILIQGAIKGAAKVQVGSDKSIIGKAGSSLEGIGLTILNQKNVILRNLKISKVEKAWGDAITIQTTTNVWVDHCDLSATRDGSVDKDFYDGLTDLSHAADFVTVSYTYYHDHSKGSLVGRSDKDASEDVGRNRVTYANCHWFNVRSRGPLLRFGTAHVYNNYYNTMDTGLNTRMGAQALIQSSVFENVGKKAIFSESSSTTGYANAFDVVLGSSSFNTAPVGKLSPTSPPYPYTLLGSANVKSTVPGQAGQILAF